MHSSWSRVTTTTEEWLEEANSLDESEEKQSWWAERSSFGSLDTWQEGEEGDREGELHQGPHHLHTQLVSLKSSNTQLIFTELGSSELVRLQCLSM